MCAAHEVDTADRKKSMLTTVAAPLIWLYGHMRSLSVGRKLMLIYVLGIFLPLTIANGLILRGVLEDAREQEQSFMFSTIEGIKSAIAREFEPIEQVSELVYADTTIYRILREPFEDFAHYVEAHDDILNPALAKYQSVFAGILRITIYTDNEIVRVSEGYLGIDPQTMNTIWMQRLESSLHPMPAMVHLDSDPRTEISGQRYISVFRKLDNLAIVRSGKQILRIDVNPVALTRHIGSSEFSGHIHLLDPWGSVAVSTGTGVDVEKESPKNSELLPFRSVFREPSLLNGWVIQGELSAEIPSQSWSERWTRLLLVSVGSIALSALLILLLSRSVIARLSALSRQMQKIEQEEFSPLLTRSNGRDEIDHLIHDFNLMAEKIDRLINEGYKMEIEQHQLLATRQEAELNALQSQVNPHYLYNVLESIRMKAHIKGEHETANVVKKLSRTFRRITSWDDDIVSLREELEFTREYLDIQQYRFGEKLHASMQIDPTTIHTSIPKLTVQGLVENACIHGIEPISEGGTVEIDVERRNGSLIITVCDNGVGCDQAVIDALLNPHKHKSRHVGLPNIRNRLKLHYGDCFSFSFASEVGVGTAVTITIEESHEAANRYNR